MQLTTKHRVGESFSIKAIRKEYYSSKVKKNKGRKENLGFFSTKEYLPIMLNVMLDSLLEHGYLEFGAKKLEIKRRTRLIGTIEDDKKWNGNEYYLLFGKTEYEFTGIAIDKLYEKVKNNWARYE